MAKKEVDYNNLPDISEVDYSALPDVAEVKKKEEPIGEETSPSLEEDTISEETPEYTPEEIAKFDTASVNPRTLMTFDAATRKKYVDYTQSKADKYKVTEQERETATQNLEILDQAMDEVDQQMSQVGEGGAWWKEEAATETDEFGVPQPTAGAEQLNLLRTQKKLIRDAKTYSSAVAKGDKQSALERFFEGTKTLDVANVVTLGISDLIQGVEVGNIARKLEYQGLASLSQEERDILILDNIRQQAEQTAMKDRSFAVGAGVAETVPFIVDMVVTSGVGAGIRKGAFKTAAGTIKSKAARKLVANLSDSTTRSLLFPSTYEAVSERTAPTVGFNEETEPIVLEGGENLLEALPKAIGSNAVEIFSEGAIGAGLSKVISKASSKGLKLMRNTKVGDIIESVSKAAKNSPLLKAASIQDPLTEFGEEVFAGIVQPIVTGDGSPMDFFEYENMVRTMLTVSVMSSAMTAPSTAAAMVNAKKIKDGETAYASLDDINKDIFNQSLQNETVDQVQEKLQALHMNMLDEDSSTAGIKAANRTVSRLSDYYASVKKAEREANKIKGASYQFGNRVFTDKEKFFKRVEQAISKGETTPIVNVRNDNESKKQLDQLISGVEVEREDVAPTLAKTPPTPTPAETTPTPTAEATEEVIPEAEEVATEPVEVSQPPVEAVSQSEQAITPEEVESGEKQAKTPMSELSGATVVYEGEKGILVKEDDGYFVENEQGERTLVESGESGMSAEEIGVFKTGEAPTYNPEDSSIEYLGKKYTYESVNTDAEGNTTSIQAVNEQGQPVTIRSKFAVEEIEYQKALSEMEQSGRIETIEPSEINQAVEELKVKPYEQETVEPAVEPVQQAGQDKGVEAPPVKEKATEQEQVAPKPTQEATKTQQRKQRIEEIDSDLGDLWSDLADIVGAKKSLTGDQQKKLAPVVSKLVKAYAEKYALKGAELIAQVKEHFSSRGINVDTDLENLIKTETDAQGIAPEVEETSEQAQGVEPEAEGQISLRDTDKDRKKEKVTPKKRRHSFDETVKKAGDMFEQMVEQDPGYYDVRTRKAAIEAAKQWLSEKGEATAYSTLKKNYNNASPDRQDRRMLFMNYLKMEFNDAVEGKDNERAEALHDMIKDILNAVRKEATIGGQASSVLRKWYVLTESASVWLVEQEIKRENDRKAMGADTKGIDESVDDIVESQKEIADEVVADKRVTEVVNEIKETNQGKKGQRTNYEKATELANKLRKVKSSNWGITLAADPISAVGIGILDGAIETTAKAIEVSGSVADAIKKGMDRIHRSEWFKGLTDAQKRKIDRIFGMNVRKGLGVDTLPKEEVEKMLKVEVKDLGESLNSIIDKHLHEVNELGISLSERIISDLGLSKAEANKVEKVVTEIIREKLEKRLTEKIAQQYIPKKAHKKQAFFDKMAKIFAMGGFNKDSFRSHFAKEFGLTEDLTKEQANEIMRLQRAVMETSEMGEYSNVVAEALLQELDKYIPRTRTEELISAGIGIGYANMLSGFSTHRVNVLSVLSSAMVQPITRLTSFGGWVNSMKSLMDGNVSGFLSNLPILRFVEDYLYFLEAAPIGLNQLIDTIKNGDIRSLNKYVSEAQGITGLSVPELEKRRFGFDRFMGRVKVKVGGKEFSIQLNPANSLKYIIRALQGMDAGMTKMFEARIMASELRDSMIKKGYSELEILKQIQRQVFGQFLTSEEINAVEEQVSYEKALVESLKLNKAPTSPTGKKIQDFMEKTKARKWSDIKANKRRLELVREKLSDFTEEDFLDINDTARYNVFNDNGGGMTSMLMNAISRFSNKNVWTKVLVMPYFPFTHVFGRIGNFMLNTSPIYSSMRASGYGVTSMWAHAKAFREAGSSWWGSKIKAVSPWQKRLPMRDLPFKTSQLGELGSAAHKEQKRQAELANILFTPIIAMVLGMMTIDPDYDDDDEPWFMISGNRFDLKDFNDRYNDAVNGGYPPYTVKMGKFRFIYKDSPIASIPLSMIGNYVDMKRAGYSDKEIDERLSLYAKAVMQTTRTLTENQLAGGFKDISEQISKWFKISQSLKDDPTAESISGKKAVKDFGKFMTRKTLAPAMLWTPAKNNAIQQTVQFITKEGKESRDIPAILAYDIGIHHWTNKGAIDIFGKQVYKLPGYTQILYPSVLKEKDPRRWDMFRFLADNNAVPAPYFNRTEEFILSEPREYKDVLIRDKAKITNLKPSQESMPVVYDIDMPTEDEFWELRRLAGNKFYDKIDNYFSNEEVWRKEAGILESGGKTRLQKKVADYYNEAKQQARLYLFTWSDFNTKENKAIYNRLFEADAMPSTSKTVRIPKLDADGMVYTDETGNFVVDTDVVLAKDDMAIYNSIAFDKFLGLMKPQANADDNYFKLQAEVNWEISKLLTGLAFDQVKENKWSDIPKD